ncbi:hypothetical protein Gohar_002728 [Gossypium harknessii]|uniref:Uncharacterized protein n=1 Tax=Gossypium harknessii TaxID=34285 RepID=A0A7J9HLP7_9ROSI|nr:hypothetical protein [Gossypium harknessii]
MASRHPRSGATVEMDPSSKPTQEPTQVAAPPLGQYDSIYFGAFTNLVIFTQTPNLASHLPVSTSMSGFILGPPSPTYYTLMPSTFQMTTYRSFMFGVPIGSPIIMPSDHCSTNVDHLRNHLFLEWRIHNGNQLQSTTNEGEKDGRLRPQPVPKRRCNDEGEEAGIQLGPRRNPTRNQ